MDVQVRVEGAEALRERFRRIPPEFLDRVGKGLKQVLEQAQGYTARTHLRGGGGATLAKRTGALTSSLRSRVDVNGARVVGEYGSYNTKYAAMHENGAPVFPKHARALWIPIGANKTAEGVPRMTPRMAIAAGAYATSRDWRSGVVMSAEGQPLFALSQGVRIPARPFIGPTYDRNIVPRFSAVLDKIATQAVSA